MAVRNLTKKFVDVRNAAKANKSLRVQDTLRDNVSEESDSGLLRAGQDNTNWKTLKDSLPPIWVDKIDQAEEDTLKIQNKMRDLAAIHTKRLMVNFETDEIQQEREIDHKTREITELFHHAESLLKKFGKQGDEHTISDSEQTVRNNMQRSLAKKLQGLSMSFRSTQKEYLNRLQAQKSGGGQAAFDFLTAEDKAAQVRGPNVDMDLGFKASQLAALDDTVELVNQRDEEITRIAKSIEELAQIFKELAVLVIDQGTILDRIDFNMESAVEHAKEGIVQLQKAEEHQKNALPMRCIIVLVVLIIIMLIVLIVKNTPQQSSSNK
jgi:syntaxin 16